MPALLAQLPDEAAQAGVVQPAVAGELKRAADVAAALDQVDRQLALLDRAGLADIAAPLHLDALNQRAVGLEGTLHAHTVGDLAHGERGVQAAVAHGDADALEGLQALAVAFFYLHVDDDGVARCKLRDVPIELLGVDFVDDVRHVPDPFQYSSSTLPAFLLLVFNFELGQ